MPSPELRCLECNRQFADLTADQEVERCAECGKFVVTAPTQLTVSTPAPGDPLADLVPDSDIPTVGKAKRVDDLPLAQPAKAAPPPMTALPAWARRADQDAPPAANPAFPPRPAATTGPAAPRSYTELPSQTADDRKQKVGLALFVAFLFLVGMVAAVGVLGYTIIRGLQMKKVITDAAPRVRPLLDADGRA